MCDCLRCHRAHRGRLKICADCRAQLTADGLAWCNACERALPHYDITPGETRCRACVSARWKARYAADPALRARHRAQALAYYRAHREEAVARLRRWRAANPGYWRGRPRPTRDYAAENARRRAQYAADPAMRARKQAASRAYWPWRKRRKEVLG